MPKFLEKRSEGYKSREHLSQPGDEGCGAFNASNGGGLRVLLLFSSRMQEILRGLDAQANQY